VRRTRPDLDVQKASKLGLLALFTRDYQNDPMNESWPLKPLQSPFFPAIYGRNPTLARGDEGDRATFRNARLARRFQAVSYELATSLELARCMRFSATAHTQ